MLKTVVVFLGSRRVGAFATDCAEDPAAPGTVPAARFQAACRDGVLARGELTSAEADRAQFVVQD